MVTFSVTIDEESHKDLFLHIMEELKFVVSVIPQVNSGVLNALDFSMSGREASDKELEELMILAEKEETYLQPQSKKINKQRFKQWQEKASK
ncbi:MAG: hypothetical protein WCR01_14985 [Bacteroidota bacterium]